jgi:uncharacterized protein (DUF934 family)
MPKLIKQSTIIENVWHKLDKEFHEMPDTQALLFPLDHFLENPDCVIGKPEAGVWLDSDQEPSALAPFIEKLSLIAINFPRFVDGRGYSYARQLRDKYNYQGELRAIGDVLQDQLFYMKRCGFDSFAVREDKDIEVASHGLNAFTECYQGATDQPEPLFRRR